MEHARSAAIGTGKPFELLVDCRSGRRACHAARVLLQAGSHARVLSGGMPARGVLVDA